MAARDVRRHATSAARWTERVAPLDDGPGRAARTPITVERIVTTAFALVAEEGFEALTMRRVAAALETGPASLYAHVRNKAELDGLLIGELCARVTVPSPDPVRWREQLVDVCGQLRDQYLRYPGVSRAAFAAVPQNAETLTLSEGLLGILLAGGVAPQSAAWAIDAAFLYVNAYCVEASLHRVSADTDDRVLDRAELVDRFRQLPADRFPHTVAYAQELTAGDGHERFDFTLDLLLRGLSLSKA